MDALLYEQHLAPYALRESASRGRAHPDHGAEYRGLFQRDRDRIVHCGAFRRLQYKTQVFVSVMEGDYYRNRLTHTLEVTQIARTIARALRLNEDLVEAISLAHDLGHGPFGHSGEMALNEVMRENGGFNHNLQGLRVVERLERRYARFAGLNLSYETREGFSKNLGARRTLFGFADEALALEAQLAGHADEIAYDTHDIEDGLVGGVIREEDLREMELWARAEREVLDEYPVLRDDKSLRWRSVVRRLIGTLVNDLLAATREALAQNGIDGLPAVRACRTPLVVFSHQTDEQMAKLQDFLHAKFYNNPIVRDRTALWQARLKQLFLAYVADPQQLPEEHLRRVETERETIERVSCDYVAGMTDRFALRRWEKIVGS